MATRKANRDVINQFVSDGIDCPDLNGYGNVRVRRGVLYSYRASIAEWHVTDEDKPVLMVNALWDGYSPTTSKHMKFLYDAITGNCESYAYRRDDYDALAGYDDDAPVVPVLIEWTGGNGAGTKKPRWERLKAQDVEVEA